MKRKRKPAAGRDFLRRTQFRFLEPSGQQQGQPPPRPFLPHREGNPLVDLPEPRGDHLQNVSLADAIDRRSSVREYLLDRPVSLSALSWLLWATQGVRHVDQIDVYRTVPSAGARHPFETFLLASRVEGLDPGLYRYLAFEPRLETLEPGGKPLERVAGACLQPELVQNAAVTFLWAAVPARMTWRYADRGYRYILIEAGHISQNLYLAVQDVGLGTCSSAAFNDDDMNRALGLDGNDLFAVYLNTVGA